MADFIQPNQMSSYHAYKEINTSLKMKGLSNYIDHNTITLVTFNIKTQIKSWRMRRTDRTVALLLSDKANS